jgi:catechol 2,3-dioxygenase-like lactoylglutathione lyase family enzyme
MDMKLEVVPIPVRDVDTAKDFCTRRVGFHLDHDVRPSQAMRVVQLAPPGSACSVVIGEGLPLGQPGSVKAVQLVVKDLDAVRSDLAGRGIAISEVQQMGPEGTPGSRYCFFEDPDGNMWGGSGIQAHLTTGSRPRTADSSAQTANPRCHPSASTPIAA